ncbi:hypothetical protein GCM10017786_50040 [Amycolatopsis deserti]|uniref:Uncharacterized protein n=1 Tax=Amycolatopsis deserti TaxID=185696 RepID=A0ABQ3J9S8_9PSEU|nr:hypothetical protein GCM10017786_50040 [Amycolatopsis deserti]
MLRSVPCDRDRVCEALVHADRATSPGFARALLVAAILTTALFVCEVTLWVLWFDDLAPWWQGVIKR